MGFVFARKRGVYALLGVNVWLHKFNANIAFKISPWVAFLRARAAWLTQVCVVWGMWLIIMLCRFRELFLIWSNTLWQAAPSPA